MSKPENKAFAQMFQKQFAGKFLELYMKLLSVVRENGYLPDRVINLALQYLSTRYILVSTPKSLANSTLQPQVFQGVFEQNRDLKARVEKNDCREIFAVFLTVCFVGVSK